MTESDWARVVWAGVGSAFMGLLAFATTFFGEPPPHPRALWRVVVIDIGLGMFGAIAAGYALAAPAAAFLNGLSAKVVAGYAAVDDKAAALIVGCGVVKLLPHVIALAEAKLKAWAAKEARPT